jgi:hypothetical protein
MLYIIFSIMLGLFLGFNLSIYWRIKDKGIQSIRAILYTVMTYLIPILAMKRYLKVRQNRQAELFRMRESLKQIPSDKYEKFLRMFNSDIGLFLLEFEPILGFKKLIHTSVTLAYEVEKEVINEKDLHLIKEMNKKYKATDDYYYLTERLKTL